MLEAIARHGLACEIRARIETLKTHAERTGHISQVIQVYKSQLAEVEGT